jgi:DNA modification methylase
VIVADLAPLAFPIDRLDALEDNPRRGDVEAVKRSYAEFGQRKPIVARHTTEGRGEVEAGNHQLAAARELGWPEIAVVWVDDDDLRAKAFALADNRTGDLGSYDAKKLAAMVGLVAADEGLLAAASYTPGDVAELIAHARGGFGDADELPEADDGPVTAEPGDRWRLGPHRLICGDARDRNVIDALLEGDEPALMVTDPPYGVELDPRWRDGVYQNVGDGARPYMMSEGHRNRTISGDIITDWSPVFELVPSVRIAYVWHAGAKSGQVIAGLERIGFEIAYQIIWDRGRGVMGHGAAWYEWRHEPCIVGRRGKGAFPFLGERRQETIIAAPSPKAVGTGSDEDKWDHPTQKPMAVIEPPILNHLAGGELVFDPFLGSGTTLMAAELHGRRCVGVEVEPRFVDLIVKRWETHTGGTAVREPGVVPPAADVDEVPVEDAPKAKGRRHAPAAATQ